MRKKVYSSYKLTKYIPERNLVFFFLFLDLSSMCICALLRILVSINKLTLNSFTASICSSVRCIWQFTADASIFFSVFRMKCMQLLFRVKHQIYLWIAAYELYILNEKIFCSATKLLRNTDAAVQLNDIFDENSIKNPNGITAIFYRFNVDYIYVYSFVQCISAQLIEKRVHLLYSLQEYHSKNLVQITLWYNIVSRQTLFSLIVSHFFLIIEFTFI